MWIYWIRWEMLPIMQFIFKRIKTIQLHRRYIWKMENMVSPRTLSLTSISLILSWPQISYLLWRHRHTHAHTHTQGERDQKWALCQRSNQLVIYLLYGHHEGLLSTSREARELTPHSNEWQSRFSTSSALNHCGTRLQSHRRCMCVCVLVTGWQ